MSRLTARTESTVSDSNAAQLAAAQHKPPRIPRDPVSPMQGALYAIAIMLALGMLLVSTLLSLVFWHFLGWMFGP